jgi:hypothetical protein
MGTADQSPDGDGTSTPPADAGGLRRARGHHARELVIGALLAALLTSVGVVILTQLWSRSLDEPFQYSVYRGDDQQDATLELMLIKNIHETGWFDSNPKLNAPFGQQWAEWPMGGDIVAYTIKKVIVDVTGDAPLTLNLFWLLTFPFVALIAYPSLRALRASPGAALVGAVLYALAPYHFRNGTAHSNLAFYVAVPVVVLACARILVPRGAFPTLRALRHRDGWRRIRWLLIGAVLVAVTGIYYLAFLLSMLAVCAVVAACAHRQWDRLVVAAIVCGAGLVAALLANLPTMSFRWTHAPNLLSVPERIRGTSEQYPLRIAELLSPVTDHRFGPLAHLADTLSAPDRVGLGTANLGAVAAIGLVVGVVATLVRPTRRGTRSGWRLEARLGVVMLVAILLGVAGGGGRLLEYFGLQGVRAWPRIAIVIAFAALAVVVRMLDRARVSLRLRGHRVPAAGWTAVLIVVTVVGVGDQTPANVLPTAGASAAAWNRDDRFVSHLEARVPRDAMVFELPVTDFPDHDVRERMSSHDLVKEGYLHSSTLRWSAGGIRGRSAEWQVPIGGLSSRRMVRGLAAIGFDALLLDTDGYPQRGTARIRDFDRLLGRPIATEGGHLLAWRITRDRVLAGLGTGARHRLAERTLRLPRLYMTTDVRPHVERGDGTPACSRADLLLVNPRRVRTPATLMVRVDRPQGEPPSAVAGVGGAGRRLAPDRPNRIPVQLRPGTTRVEIRLHVPHVRCDDVDFAALPVVSASVEPGSGR